MHTKIRDLLNLAVANKASDIHLSVNSVPKLRITGILTDVANFDISDKVLMAEMILSLCEKDQQDKVSKNLDLDFSIELGEARFRCNMYFEK